MSLLMFIFLEIVLGIDNIIFIFIVFGKLLEEECFKVINIGLILVMVLCIVLLFGVFVLVVMEEFWFEIYIFWMYGGFFGQSIIFIIGGLFLLYKSIIEICYKFEEEDFYDEMFKGKVFLINVIIQIIFINIVFFFDFILIVVGMINGVIGVLIIMIIVVVVFVVIMMLFVNLVVIFVNKNLII